MAGATGIGLTGVVGTRTGQTGVLTKRTEDLILPSKGKILTHYYIYNKSIPNTQNPFKGLLQFEWDKAGAERYAKKYKTRIKVVKFTEDSKGLLYDSEGSYMVKNSGGRA